MATIVRMPSVLAGATEAAIANWLVAPGDAVEAGTPIAEIETEKALVEYAAEEAGVIGRLVLAAGDSGETGDPIAVLVADGETDADIDAALGVAPALAAESNGHAGAHAGRVFASPLVRKLAGQRGIDLAALTGTGPNGRIVRRDLERFLAAQAATAATPPAGTSAGTGPASPSALSAEAAGDAAHGTVHPADLAGTAAGAVSPSALSAEADRVIGSRAAGVPAAGGAAHGTVHSADLAGTAAGAVSPSALSAEASRVIGSRAAGVRSGSDAAHGTVHPSHDFPGTAAAAGAPASAEGSRLIPHTPMRRAIARRLTESKAAAPHFYLTAECVVDDLLALREQVNEASPVRVSVNDFVIMAAAAAFSDVPEANVTWSDEGLIAHGAVDISIAVATGGGLIAPVLRGVDGKRLSAIARESRDLAARARDRRLRVHEIEGGTFSISNLGMYGTLEFSAIINPPQSGILAVGAARQQPVVVDGSLAVATVMRCTLSVDHRAIDGALAARWLAAFTTRLEHPLATLI